MLYQRIIIRFINIFLPFYYHLSNAFNSSKYKLDKSKLLNETDKYVVSLTSFPPRIDKVWLVIESILRQKSRPDAILLWLYKDEFDGKSSLPPKLLALETRGLQIKFCEENIMPHKKYYYTLKQYPKANIITIDDDIIYPPDFIEKLKFFHHQFPDCICATIIQEITTDRSSLNPYSKWPIIETNTEPSFKYLQIGAGGVLYPSNSLHPEVLNISVFTQLALSADDLWLKVMSVKQRTKVLGLSGEYARTFIPLIIKNNQSLMDKNVTKGENNKIIRNILKYYGLKPTIFDDKCDSVLRSLN